MSKKETSIFYKTKRREVPKDNYIKPPTPHNEIPKEGDNPTNGGDKNKWGNGNTGGYNGNNSESTDGSSKASNQEDKSTIIQIEKNDKSFPWWWLILLLLLLLIYLFNDKQINEYIDKTFSDKEVNNQDSAIIKEYENNQDKSDTISHLITREELNRGIVKKESIEKYKNNPNNTIENIGDIDGDGQDDYIVISKDEIEDDIIRDDNINIPLTPPNLNCSDSIYTKDWFKSNIGYTELVEDYIEQNRNNTPITIAVIDTGISLHSDLLNVIDDSDLSSNIDNNGHGTNVAGVINTINPNAQILPIKVSNDEAIPLINAIIGLKSAIDKDPDIINMSFGVKNRDIILEKLVNDALEKGIIVISSAGNESDDVSVYFPASYNGVLSIGSSDPDDIISDFSNYGDEIDFLLPGECIYTTNLDDTYIKATGTSFGAPMMSGIVSLYLEKISLKLKISNDELNSVTISRAK